jgi:hypothetical protein
MFLFLNSLMTVLSFHLGFTLLTMHAFISHMVTQLQMSNRKDKVVKFTITELIHYLIQNLATIFYSKDECSFEIKEKK